MKEENFSQFQGSIDTQVGGVRITHLSSIPGEYLQLKIFLVLICDVSPWEFEYVHLKGRCFYFDAWVFTCLPR